jgi:two-component system response regulator PhoP
VTTLPTLPTEKQLNILVVDDESGTRAALGAVLRLTGHEADFAVDGDEAIEMIEHADAPYDLIITDHMMARVSGLDLVRQLRERGFGGEIVVLTAYAGSFEEQEYEKLEVAGIMGKPFEITELRLWLDCIYTSRERNRALNRIEGLPNAVHFFWLKHEEDC